MAIINERIKTRRKLLNKTLLEIAEYLGVQEATVQRYESGEIKNIPYDNIVLIAECLKCTPQYLMGWSDTVNPDIVLSQHEQNLILAYRKQPAMQEAVDKLLGIPSDINFPVDDVVATINAIDKSVQKARCSKTQK